MGDDVWDVIVVGAGPAGGMAAALLATRGWRVLLVEKARWPREKVCGGCINAAGIALLNDAGLGGVLDGVASLGRFALSVGRRRLSLPLPEGAAIPRDVFDARLVAAAVGRGVTFRPETTAVLLAVAQEGYREVQLTDCRGSARCKARLVLVADGISGTTLQQESWAGWSIAGDAHFGVATTLGGLCTARHTIAMHVGEAGYVGLAAYADGRTHLAAALDPVRTKILGGPCAAVEAILAGCDVPIPNGLAGAKYQGTPHLTRRRRILGHHRVLAIGDACGYVEPFTGEGIAWALRSATAVAALLPDSLREWRAELPAEWLGCHRAAIGGRQRLCRVLRHTLRHPHVARAVVAVANLFPRQGAALVEAIGHQSFAATVLAGVLQ